jgi:hypothetical protein
LAKFLLTPFSKNNTNNHDNNNKVDKNFRRACANIIKKYYYSLSQNKKIDKQPYLEIAY